MHTIARLLYNPNTFLKQIQHLQKKLLDSNRLYETTQDGVSFYQFCLHSKQLSQILAKQIKHETYQYQPAIPYLIKTKTKQRLVYGFYPSDRIVQFALHQCLSPYVEELISDDVFSYIPGRSNFQAAQKLAHYLQRHKEIFALRCDIMSYTDNIPVQPDSILWQYIDNLVNLIDPTHTLPEYIKNLISSGIRPVIRSKQNTKHQLRVGLPQGAPLTTVAANLYLQSIDNVLSKITGSCYARFGDDLIFLHPDHNTVLEVNDLLNQQLTKLKLRRNNTKEQMQYITSNGRHGHQLQFIPSHKIDFVGYAIHSNGTVAVGTQTCKKLLNTLKQRIDNTATLTYNLPLDTRGKNICSMLNRNYMSLDSNTEPRLKQLLQHCTNRQQLKHLDYNIAQYIAKKLTGLPSVKAFRQISYKRIRSDWGLQSLCVLRNNCR